VKQVRVIFIGLTQMLREIVSEAVGREQDVDIVRSYPSAADLTTAVAESEAAVVIAGADLCDSATVCKTLRRFPRLKIVSISDDARQIALHELTLRRRSLGDPSAARMLAAIRSATRCS
jgi:DNA-binding NarL/FixJ family response regulator